jgi:hypothetical protein
MTGKWSKSEVDAFREILGLDLPEDRVDADLQAFKDIGEAIRKLRERDLTNVHPAVIFRPDRGQGRA